MSTLSVRLPDSIHRQVRELAKEDGVSINQFISLALAEKVSSLRTVEFLKQRAARGSSADMLSILDGAPDVEPEEHDKIK
ncbi:toxin-antitoxin system HicB family antitoxin [Oscillatoria laete-virens NRMC-F 0139]|nr:toxin-antitoxin system HicB family antitoxin [Oscillatoria laete-virens]MDL5053613.1 toxin-antitoxin system HicB family antitoxin [Oscillatoria laete-virens NRMC-F 0139]